jgi:hypothetical protein
VEGQGEKGAVADAPAINPGVARLGAGLDLDRFGSDDDVSHIDVLTDLIDEFRPASVEYGLIAQIARCLRMASAGKDECKGGEQKEFHQRPS